MKFFLMLLLSVFAGSAAVTQDAQTSAEPMLDVRPADAIKLDDFLWRNRLIIVFADTPIDPRFQEQMDLLAENPQDLIDRDVIVITDTNPQNPSPVRQKLRPRGFGFVLIDKDGVIKLRKPIPWDVREISRSIDKTELRKEELRIEREKGAPGL